MLTYITHILQKVDRSFWKIFAITFITTPIAITYMVVHSGSIEYKNADIQINLQGKKLTDDTTELIQKLTEKLNKLEMANKELSGELKRKKLDKQLQPQIEKVDRAIVESGMVAEDLTKNQEQLKDFVEEINPK